MGLRANFEFFRQFLFFFSFFSFSSGLELILLTEWWFKVFRNGCFRPRTSKDRLRHTSIASDTPACPALVTPESSTCPGCSETFDDSTRAPRVLKQCGHTICDRCVRTNTTRTSANDVVVICRHIRWGRGCGMETRMKEGERLAINLVLLEFLASLRQDAPSGGCNHYHLSLIHI